MSRVFTHISEEELAELNPKSAFAKRVASIFEEQKGQQWKWYRDQAKEQYHRDGETEVDEDACVSVSDDNGAYVQAWVWVDDKCCQYCDDPLRPGEVCEKAGCQE